jgi:hypothetical protein
VRLQNTARPAPEQTGNGPRVSSFCGVDTSHLASKEPILQAPRDAIAQAKIGLVLDDVADNSGLMIGTLHCALAMRDAGDTVGLVYTLRRAKAYWRAISASAVDLVATDAERLSPLRQREESR